MRRRALLSVFLSVPFAGCSVVEELAPGAEQPRIPREDRLSIVSQADQDLVVRFVVTHVETGETLVDNTKVVEPGQEFTFAAALPRRGSALLVIDVEDGTRFERAVHDYEDVTIEIQDTETVEVTELVEV